MQHVFRCERTQREISIQIMGSFRTFAATVPRVGSAGLSDHLCIRSEWQLRAKEPIFTDLSDGGYYRPHPIYVPTLAKLDCTRRRVCRNERHTEGVQLGGNEYDKSLNIII
jgi:hypothetical protein